MLSSILGALLRPRRPELEQGPGTPIGCFRGRLPASAVDDAYAGRGLMVQVHYPATQGKAMPALESGPWFRPEVIQEIATGYGIPRWLLGAMLGRPRQFDPPLAARSRAGTVEESQPGGWPVVIFTSGIWGCYEMYTQFCREIAASGAIVLALEHEDGSGVFAVDGATSQPLRYIRPPEAGDYVKFREPFLERRAQDLRDCVHAVRAAAQSAPSAEAASVEEALQSVMRNADPTRMTLVGHSFGSSGILRYLRRSAERGEQCPYNGVLLLDLYSAPLVKQDLQRKLQVPFAMIFSESWSTESLRVLTASNAGQCLGAAQMRGTRHQWISESHFFAPAWLLRRIGIMGPGDHRVTFRTTLAATRLSLQALSSRSVRPPTAGTGFWLRERFAELPQEVLVNLDI